MVREQGAGTPSAKWCMGGNVHTEGFDTASIRYDLTFDYKEGTFRGSGSDVDGDFVVDDGVFSPTTGRFEWTQRTKLFARYPCVTDCVASASKVKADGLYGRPSSRSMATTRRTRATRALSASRPLREAWSVSLLAFASLLVVLRKPWVSGHGRVVCHQMERAVQELVRVRTRRLQTAAGAGA